MYALWNLEFERVDESREAEAELWFVEEGANLKAYSVARVKLLTRLSGTHLLRNRPEFALLLVAFPSSSYHCSAIFFMDLWFVILY